MIQLREHETGRHIISLVRSTHTRKLRCHDCGEQMSTVRYTGLSIPNNYEPRLKKIYMEIACMLLSKAASDREFVPRGTLMRTLEEDVEEKLENDSDADLSTIDRQAGPYAYASLESIPTSLVEEAISSYEVQHHSHQPPAYKFFLTEGHLGYGNATIERGVVLVRPVGSKRIVFALRKICVDKEAFRIIGRAHVHTAVEIGQAMNLYLRRQIIKNWCFLMLVHRIALPIPRR